MTDTKFDFQEMSADGFVNAFLNHAGYITDCGETNVTLRDRMTVVDAMSALGLDKSEFAGCFQIMAFRASKIISLRHALYMIAGWGGLD